MNQNYEPQVSLHRRTIDIPAACSPDGHLMNVLELPPPCRCTTSEYDGVAYGSVVSTTAQDRNLTNHHSVEKVPGDCIETQEVPKVHHSNKSSRPGHGCILNEQHPESNQPITNNWQCEDPRSIGESNVENLASVVQPLPEDAERASPRVSEEDISHKTCV